MKTTCTTLILSVLIQLPTGAAHAQETTDIHGDPLPKNAVCRLGSYRMRMQGVPVVVRFSTDGKTLAFGTRYRIQMCDVATGQTLTPVTNLEEPVRIGTKQTRPLKRHRVFVVDDSKRRVTFDRDLRLPGFSPDGKTVGTWLQMSDRFGKPIGDNTLQLWDTQTGKLKQEIKPEKNIGRASVEFSPDGRFVLARGGKDLILFDLEAGTQKVLLSIEGNGSAYYAFIGNSTRLAFGEFYEGTITVLDLPIGKTLFTLPKEFATRFVRFGPNGRIAHGGEGGKLHIWSEDGKQEEQNIDIGDNVVATDFSPDGKLVAVMSGLFRQSKVRLFEVETGKEVHAIPRHEQRIDTLTFSPDGSRIVSGSVDKTVRIWDARTGKQLGVVGTNTPWDERGQARANAMSPDGKTLIVGVGRNQSRSNWQDDEIAFCDSMTGKVQRRIPGPDGHIFALAFTVDGKSIISLSADREVAPEATDKLFHHHSIHVREIATGRVTLRIPKLRAQDSRRLVVSPNGQLAAVLPQNVEYSKITIVDLQSGKVLKQLKGRDVAFSANGKLLAIAAPKHISVWDVRTWGEPQKLGGSNYRALAFSPDSKYLAAPGYTSSKTGIGVFDVSTGEIVWETTDVSVSRKAVAFSPDGKSIVSVCDEITAVVWNFDKP